ncbi:DNA polymerase [bacterium]|nr:DNA polymerase [bacterium]
MTKQEQKKIILLDVHAILHRAYHALPDFKTRAGEPTGGLYGLSAMLFKIIGDLKPDYIAACYDLPDPTFRHKAYEDYKAKREKAPDELVSQIVRSRDIFEAFGIPVYDRKGFEADDILATIVENLKDEKNLSVIIASGDMDTLQLVEGSRVTVYTLKKGINDTILYDEKAVRARFGFAPEFLPDFKGLKGDPSDNILGVKGIGDKTAALLVGEFHTIENIFDAIKKKSPAFEKIGIKRRIVDLLEKNEEEALFSKMLATVRRDAPIFFKLPEKRWHEGANPEKIEKIFSELEFTRLKDRAREILGLSAPLSVPEQGSLAGETGPTEGEVLEIGIALWLCNSDMTNPSRENIEEYTGTTDLAKAREIILKELAEKKLEKVYRDIELPLIPILAEAEARGIRLDSEYLKKISKVFHAELLKIEKDIYREAGAEFNINSPKQLSDILFEKLNLSRKGLRKTPTGAVSTKESELEKLRGEHAIVDLIMKHRELQKLLSTYADNLPNMVGKDGKVHTKFNQAGTTTGRLSSQDPNMQNIPVHGEFGGKIRDAFRAEDGHTFIALDYSQVEMRVLGILSGDKEITNFFKKGLDAHTGVAARVFGVLPSEVTPDMRRRAKVINFGIIFGMGITSLQKNLGGSRAEAEEFYDNFFASFPAVSHYFEQVKRDARKKGYTETLFGRRRYFSGLNSDLPYVRAMAERMAMNAPIQGTATADIIKIAMIRVDQALKDADLSEKAHLVLQVHDELVYEVFDEAVSAAADIIKRAMENVIKTDIPLKADVSTGKRWGSLTKVESAP